MRACAAIALDHCAETYTLTLAFQNSDGTTASGVSSYVAFLTANTSNSVRINPTLANQLGTYKIVVTMTPTNKLIAIPAFTSVTLTVACKISAIGAMVTPTPSSALTYNLLTPALNINFAAAAVSPNTQTMLCGFPLTSTYAFSGAGYDTSFMTGTSDGNLKVQTNLRSKINTFSVTVTQTITDATSKLHDAAITGD